MIVSMDKKITTHARFVETEIVRIAEISNEKDRAAAARKLAKFHDSQTKNFQHERAIHLGVTFFFAGLMLLSWAVFMISMRIIVFGFGVSPMTLALGTLTLILTVLEAFYIRHYYLLENRTQKLYDLTDEIYKLI